MEADVAEGIISARSNAGISTTGIHAGHLGGTLGINAALRPTSRRTSYVVGHAGADGSATRHLALGVRATWRWHARVGWHNGIGYRCWFYKCDGKI